MAISTNSVIHYTDTLDNLKGILQHGFRLKYCLEEWEFRKSETQSLAYPMVSFCDIPLTEVTNHIDAYGGYGIGLTKNWASSNGLNPVLYIDVDSNLAKCLDDQIQKIRKSKVKFSAAMAVSILQVLGYVKNYCGDLTRGDNTVKNYIFYNEREWRYVPEKKALGGKDSELGADEYLNEKEKHNQNIGAIYLPFSPKDISYIIVEKDEDIRDIIPHIRYVYSDVCTATQLEILLTRIHTIENIKNDF